MKTERKPMNKLERILCVTTGLTILLNDIIQLGNIHNPGYHLTNSPFYETHAIALALASIATISYYTRGKK